MWGAVAQRLERRALSREEAAAISFNPRCHSSLSCINEYLATDSGGCMKELSSRRTSGCADISGGLVCLLAVLVIVCVLSPDPIGSQCTTKYCDNGDNDANVMTLVSRMQQQLAEPRETIISMKQEVAQFEEESGIIALRAAQDCTDLLREGNTRSGVYYTHVPGTETVIPVYCDMETEGGGLLVFQRHQDGSVDFYRDWDTYKRGFGDVSGEFWPVLGGSISCSHETTVNNFASLSQLSQYLVVHCDTIGYGLKTHTMTTMTRPVNTRVRQTCQRSTRHKY
ncbi:hypothetical protein LSAT2_022656 [Lamellibrachia satsuma]|nr:hypothetical protein LSAT2_022656 [Lamellibrachia satsuma]